MKTINQKMREFTDEQIEIAFQESEEWRKTGVLEDGVLSVDCNIKIHRVAKKLLCSNFIWSSGYDSLS